MSTVVSAKIPKRLREQLRERQINVSAVVRTALEEEIHRLEKEELRVKLDRLKEALSGKVSTKDIVKAVRSSRNGR